MRKHGGRQAELAVPQTGSWSIPKSRQPPFSPNYGESHAYEITHQHDACKDDIKKTETLQDQFLESFRKINEANRLMNEFSRNSTPESSLSEIAKFFMVQTVSDLFQGRCNMPTRKEILPSGYQISLCDTCLSGCKLRPVLYPIEFEAVIKLVHECDSKNLFTSQNQNEEEILEKKRHVQASLGDMLSQVVSSRIGQREAYLKARKLSQNAFSEETRRKWKLPPNRSLIEEKDCIKFNPSRDMANIDHWFHRTIRDYDEDSDVKVTQGEPTEFLQIAKATFGVFQVDTNDPAKKYYFLIYLVL